jgi:lambda family phage portal protein
MKLFGLNITRDGAPKSRRNYDGARRDDYTADWLMTDGPSDVVSRASVATLRSRGRDLERNNPYAEAILAECESNIVGPNGFMIKPKPRRVDSRVKGGITSVVDTVAAEKIGNWWADHCRRGNFDVTGQFSAAEYTRMAVRSTVRDGGSLTRLVDGFAGNSTRFAVQGLEIDTLDPAFNDPAQNISMSVQFDDWWKPVTYYLKEIRRDGQNRTFERKPITARDILHVHRAHRFSSTQSPSWLATAMLSMRHLNQFEIAEVIAARSEAEKLGFFKETGEGRYEGEDDGTGRLIAPSSPGQWERLPAGVEPHSLDPSHPNSNFPDFRKAILRQICAGLPVNYNIIAQDLEGVSFSSIRQGVLSERDSWRVLQNFFADSLICPIYERALLMALTSGQIEGLSERDYSRLVYKEISGRNWHWVDPVRDIEAKEREVALGINSRQNIAREAGRPDFSVIVRENEEDSAILESAGLPTNAGNAQAPPVPVRVEE